MWRYLLITCLCALGFSVNAQVDKTSGTTAPDKVSRSISDLSWYLCEGLVSDSAKANRIFNWVTHNIAFDIQESKNPDRNPPVIQNILDERKTVTEGYTLLYTEMCKTVGLKAVRVEGYVKNWHVDDSDKIYMARHEWCAVMIDRRWELIDPVLGTGDITRETGWFQKQLNLFSKDEVEYDKKNEVFEFNYDSSYFLVDPIEFRKTHLSADPMWQLARDHMPMEVFELGDSAIAAYNKAHPERISRSPELSYISRLTYGDQVVEFADRAYKFNPVYYDILTRKELIKTSEVLAKHIPPRSKAPRSQLEDAYRGMVLALRYVDSQRSYFPDKYNDLRRKNVDKNRAAKQRIRNIRVANKKYIAQCHRREFSAERKKVLLEKRKERADDKAERIEPDKIDSLKTIGTGKDKNDPILVTLSDSINTKTDRIKKSNFAAIDHMQGITLLQDANNVIRDSLVSKNELADTLLSMEARARLAFRDNYDSEVRQLMKLFNKVRFEQSDTLLYTYLDNFDTIVAYYEDLQNVYEQQIWTYRGLLRDMEQYRRWNNTEDQILRQYSNNCQKYNECISQYKQSIEVFENYLAKNETFFKELIENYEGELLLLDKMDTAEDTRREAEETVLEEQRAYDNRIMERREQAAEQYKETLTTILSKP